MNRRNKTVSAVFKRFTLYFQMIPFTDFLLIYNFKAYLCQSSALLNSLDYNDIGFLFTAVSIDS